uniref:Uncharacterized protein n=1 Tax=Euplotes harpa TaxID=151035 RepID=A0A7S3J5R0_9SPIT|mmetsp:Transcript_18651/g.21426  ORF Transcript_18651/g.21426 Transcript_18651/m.21426 type:complete len:113 (+) Transcript_18651:441-779(+)
MKTVNTKWFIEVNTGVNGKENIGKSLEQNIEVNLEEDIEASIEARIEEDIKKNTGNMLKGRKVKVMKDLTTIISLRRSGSMEAEARKGSMVKIRRRRIKMQMKNAIKSQEMK